jgi:plastocyanin
MISRSWGWALLALALGVPHASAGTIVGRVRWTSDPRSDSWKISDRLPEHVTDAVVTIERMPAKAERKLVAGGGRAQVVQARHRFTPFVLAVTQGTTVVFRNQDLVYHNAFSRTPGNRFDIGKYPPRAQREVLFDRPGVVQMYCDIHPSMSAYVVVVPHRGYTRPDDSGRFAMKGLPAGDYTLRVWHPTRGTKRVAVNLPRRGDVNVEFKL